MSLMHNVMNNVSSHKADFDKFHMKVSHMVIFIVFHIQYKIEEMFEHELP